MSPGHLAERWGVIEGESPVHLAAQPSPSPAVGVPLSLVESPGIISSPIVAKVGRGGRPASQIKGETFTRYYRASERLVPAVRGNGAGNWGCIGDHHSVQGSRSATLSQSLGMMNYRSTPLNPSWPKKCLPTARCQDKKPIGSTTPILTPHIGMQWLSNLR